MCKSLFLAEACPQAIEILTATTEPQELIPFTFEGRYLM